MLKPIPPSPEDCCGQGCIPCVNDIYEAELKLWEKAVANNTNQDKNCDLEKCIENNEVILRDTYSTYKLKEILPVIANTKIYRFSLQHSNACLISERTEIGQHVILRVPVPTAGDIQTDAKGGYITRQYTILSLPTCKGYFDIMIKLYQNGNASKVISNWNVGDLVEFRGPFGEFPNKFMKPSETKPVHLLDHDHIILIAAGTGIAPMIQVINFILEDEEIENRIHLFYSCKNSSEILLKDQLKDFADFWNFKVTYFLTDQDKKTENIAKLKSHLRYADVEMERISKHKIERYLVSRNIEVISSKNSYFVCGTKQFEIDIINNLKFLHIPESCIFKF